MRVFVTGASGWVGSGLVPDLLAHGHTVAALARSDRSAAALRSAGAEVVPGSLDDLGVLGDAAAAADAVVHLGFKHDIAFAGDYGRAARDDRAVIDVFAERLSGTGKALVIASGVLGVVGVGPGVVATERDGRGEHETAGPVSGGGDRSATARYVLSLADHGIRSSVVRLPPATHGTGDNGFTAAAVAAARKAGASAYAEDGANRWPAVHRDDAAVLFRLGAESAPAGSVLHAVAEEGVPIREVAEAIAAGTGVPAISVPRSDIGRHLGFLGGFWSTDGPASARLTRERFGWTPTRPTWLDDLRGESYYRT
ncbi:NAD(P)H-binding protein [Streptomyces sp. HNM0575]|uniref:NAD-dependent epimerase/dehydratase family protein n=1 Tax=Streptomyces sp. HNM0575 TaxID=2716338 RepID=UPI00145F5391|nr:NAD-dependent epimerase/dehydratase family protein [Streptomyces sp. HNM0575]NLU72744.1 NAD(P)H-binding protein [Streptomyces sp. HNM0575]